MSDIQLNTESTEQPVCVSEIVTGVIDMSKLREVMKIVNSKKQKQDYLKEI